MRVRTAVRVVNFAAVLAVTLEGATLVRELAAPRIEGGAALAAQGLSLVVIAVALGYLGAPSFAGMCLRVCRRAPLVAAILFKCLALAMVLMIWVGAAIDDRNVRAVVIGAAVIFNSAATQGMLALVNSTSLRLVVSAAERVRDRICWPLGCGAGLMLLAYPFRPRYLILVAALAAYAALLAIAAALPRATPAPIDPIDRGARRGWAEVMREVGWFPLALGLLNGISSGIYESYINIYLTTEFGFARPTLLHASKLVLEVLIFVGIGRLAEKSAGSILLIAPSTWAAAMALLMLSLATQTRGPIYLAALLAGGNASGDMALAWVVDAAGGDDLVRAKGQGLLAGAGGCGRLTGAVAAWLLTATGPTGAVPYGAIWATGCIASTTGLVVVATRAGLRGRSLATR